MKKYIVLIFFGIMLMSCNVEQQPINYGSDACHYCEMTIVDKQHASQLVTSKGKAYKYDAVECMVHSLQDEFQDTDMALHLVADFNQPGILMDAKKASFLVSENLQSPMGANLSAFADASAGKKALETYSGKLYSWEDIQKHLKL